MLAVVPTNSRANTESSRILFILSIGPDWTVRMRPLDRIVLVIRMLFLYGIGNKKACCTCRIYCWLYNSSSSCNQFFSTVLEIKRPAVQLNWYNSSAIFLLVWGANLKKEKEKEGRKRKEKRRKREGKGKEKRRKVELIIFSFISIGSRHYFDRD
jgi:hypothetical protein